MPTGVTVAQDIAAVHQGHELKDWRGRYISARDSDEGDSVKTMPHKLRWELFHVERE